MWSILNKFEPFYWILWPWSVPYLQPAWRGFLQLGLSPLIRVQQVTCVVLKCFQRLWEKGEMWKQEGKSTQVRLLNNFLNRLSMLFNAFRFHGVGSKRAPSSQQPLPTALTAPPWLVAAAPCQGSQIHRQTSAALRDADFAAYFGFSTEVLPQPRFSDMLHVVQVPFTCLWCDWGFWCPAFLGGVGGKEGWKGEKLNGWKQKLKA